MKTYIGIVVGILAIAGFALFALNRTGVPAENGKVRVVTSFYPLYFLTSEIGGDRAEVINITPAGAEPHEYEPTAQDMVLIEQADLLVLNGGVEAWGVRVQQNIPPRTHTITVGEGLETQQVVEDGKTIADPHVWLAPSLAAQMVGTIERAYEQADPENAAYYSANAATLVQKLADLDAEYRAGLASCAKRDIITAHAAFGYLAAVYGLRQVPITGLSPDAEPSVQQMAEIADFAKKNNVKYIFFESLVSPRLAQTIASEIGAQTLVLDPLEGIAPDAMSQGADYFTVMRENLRNLRTALVCG